MADWKLGNAGEPADTFGLTQARRAEIMASLSSEFPNGVHFEAKDVLERHPELRSIERIYYFLSTGVEAGKIQKISHRKFAMAPENQSSTESLSRPTPEPRRKKLSPHHRVNIFRLLAAAYPSPVEFTVQDVVDLGIGTEQKTQINNLLSAAITRNEVIRVGGGRFRFDPAKEHIYRSSGDPKKQSERAPEIQAAAAGDPEETVSAATTGPVAHQPPARTAPPSHAPPEPTAPQQPAARQSVARARDLEPRDLAHLQVLVGLSRTYESGECFSKGDFLRPTHRFRAEVYGDRYPLDLEQDLYPLCLVVDEIEPNPDLEDAAPPPYDIFIAYVDDRGQVHTKMAGSWQFSRIERRD